MAKSWFKIKNKAGNDTDTAELFIYDEIGIWGITAKDFAAALGVVSAGNIDLHINSPGGSVYDGIAIQNIIKNHKSNVTVYIDGLAASIASIIALAGDIINIADNAYVMIHNPSSMVCGGAKEMEKEMDLLLKISDGLASDYSKKMGITAEAARILMDDETWYLGQEAVAAGFADHIYTGTKAAATFDAKRFTNKAPGAVIERFSMPNDNVNKKEGLIPMEKEEKKAQETEIEEEAVETETSVPEKQETVAKGEPEASIESRIAAALEEDRKRQGAIMALGEKFGFVEDAKKHSLTSTSVTDFQTILLDKAPEAWTASLSVKNPTTQPGPEADNSAEEGASVVSLLKERRMAKFGK